MTQALHRVPVETGTPRMAALARLPLFFNVDRQPVVVAGGSAAAAWKAELLSAAGAEVRVYSPDPSAELLSLANGPPRGTVTVIRRSWCEGDLDQAALAIGAFDDDAAAARYASAAQAAGVPVNIIDKPSFCDFSFGAIVNRSPLVVGISTDGAAPVLAQAIRAKIEALLPQTFARWAAAAARWRGAVKASGLSFGGRRTFWQRFTALALAHVDREPSDRDLSAVMAEVKGLGVATENGSVTLVGAGPGDPELLTLRAVRALQSADVILFDDLVSTEVLDFARREARKILVGKTGHGPACKQEDINALLVKLARAGRRVVRLKGGDPLVFARAGEEIAACRAAGIAVEIVPGISAAQGAAARLGIPLTDRNLASRVQFITGHAKTGTLQTDINWSAVADPSTTTAIYMPSRTIGVFVANALRHGVDPQIPSAVVANATRAGEAQAFTPLVDLPIHIKSLSGPVLVLVGRVLKNVDSERQGMSVDARRLRA